MFMHSFKVEIEITKKDTEGQNDNITLSSSFKHLIKFE